MDAEEHELLGDILMAINIEQTGAIYTVNIKETRMVTVEKTMTITSKNQGECNLQVNNWLANAWANIEDTHVKGVVKIGKEIT